MASLSTHDKTMPDTVRRFVESKPQPEFVEAYIIDVNGLIRGKRLQINALESLYESGLNLPGSTALLDITGEDVEDTGLFADTGDRDYTCWPVPDALRPLPWNKRPAGQLLLELHSPDGKPFRGDPRVVLDHAVQPLRDRGLTPVVAAELEFRLLETELDDDGVPKIARRSSREGRRSQLYSLDELGNLDDLFSEIRNACLAQGLPIDTTLVEQGEGQYEINLVHVADPLLAADYALLLKRTVKRCARARGMVACFMAKPFGDEPGNGMHFHVSLIDEDGNNVFTDGEAFTPVLYHALGGLLSTMADSVAVFAPHANSYRRFQPGNHAPMTPAWGVDNRTTALRVPLADPEATRVEHRVAGADANPYLALAAILGGIEHGLANAIDPPPQTVGNAYEKEGPELPDNWGEALNCFEKSAFIGNCFGADYQRWYLAVKRQERERLRQIVPPIEYDLYLQTV